MSLRLSCLFISLYESFLCDTSIMQRLFPSLTTPEWLHSDPEMNPESCQSCPEGHILFCQISIFRGVTWEKCDFQNFE